MNAFNSMELNSNTNDRFDPPRLQRTERVNIRVSEYEKDLLKSQSERYGLSVSSYIRLLVDLDIQHYNQLRS